MKALHSYLSAWKSIWKYRYPILFLYLANLVFTFIVSSPYTIYFKKKMNTSDVLDDIQGFDIYMLGEFLNNYGEGLQPLMVLFFIVVVFYFLFAVYANSAILYAVASKNSYIPLRSFWNGGLNYYWRIFRLSLYYLLALMAVLAGVWFALLAIGINVLEVFDDRELLMKVRIGLAVFTLLSVIFYVLKQYAKILIALKNQPFITGALLQSGRFTFKYFLTTLLLYIINLLAFIALVFLYIKLRNLIDVNAWVATFLLAQVLLLLKITCRIIHLHSCLELYKRLEA